ncbi:unnamed protein product [Anisakis simplex]|uniref:acetate--CoA ligase n=1 Tax=Anisakis simplex TaxID=6269 RepID=A0A0M3J087_ANISI|nr:unnamed protein product [Anisakis simplex]
MQIQMDSVRDLTYQCLERWTERLDKDEYRLFWEGNYYDSDVHDYAELTNETLKVLVSKCINVLIKLDVKKHTKVAVYLPALIQLPVITLAAHRIGAKLLITSAIDEDAEQLGAVLKEFDPEIIITVDGFWCGSKLKQSKCIIDKALSFYQSRCRHVIVIRHVTPNEGVPPPQKHLTAKRPYYLYKISMEEGRDLWWSDLFVNVQSSSSSLSLNDRELIEEISAKTDIMYQAKWFVSKMLLVRIQDISAVRLTRNGADVSLELMTLFSALYSSHSY